MSKPQEGLLCPECPTHPHFATQDELLKHFYSAHVTNKPAGKAEESSLSAIITTLQGFVIQNKDLLPFQEIESDDSNVTQRHWSLSPKCHVCGVVFVGLNRRHHCRCCGNAFCSLHWGCIMRVDRMAQLRPEGYRVVGCRSCFNHWEEMMGDTMTVQRSLTDTFLSQRTKNISLLEVETDKLFSRLKRISQSIMTSQVNGVFRDSKKAKQNIDLLEQQVVPWQDASIAYECKECQRPLHMFSRVHHCRLCGKVLCDYSCSQKIALAYLNKIGQFQEVEKGQESVDNILEYAMRVCTSCRHLMKRREAAAARGRTRSLVAYNYRKFSALKWKADQLMKEAKEIIEKKKVTQDDVNRGRDLKVEVKAILGKCDTISQKIIGIALPDGIIPTMSYPKQTTQFPQGQAVQVNVRRAAIQYLRNNYLQLQAIPLEPTPPSPKTIKKTQKRPPPLIQKMTNDEREAAIAVHKEQREYILATMAQAKSSGDSHVVSALQLALSDLEAGLEDLGVNLKSLDTKGI